MKSEKSIPALLSVAGEMGQRILEFDWGKTPLGPMRQWSTSLRTTVSLVLNSRFPMLLWWGEEYICIYNDAYIPVLGVKHPWGLGKPVKECWSEIWHVLKPLIDTPFSGGQATWMDDICLIINRNDFVEETHFTIAYSPAPDTTVVGGIGGVLATVVETTAQVVNERALETLRKLSSYLMGGQSEKEVLINLGRAIGQNPGDFPFALIYSIDEDVHAAQLTAVAGIGDRENFAPATLVPDGVDGLWGPVWEAIETKEPVVFTDLVSRFGPLPRGSWEEPPSLAMAIPITIQGRPAPGGVMIAALNPFRRLDDQYRSFIRLVTDQIVQALTNAAVIEAERKRSEAIAALDAAKTQFFSNISHEFRTPITLILGPLEELLNKPAGEWSGARPQVEAAYRNAFRLLKLVNTLLDFSRLESGGTGGSFVATDIAAYTRNLAENFRPAIERAGLRFDVRTGPVNEPVYLDEAMWEKIVFNLLSNAFKYTLEGSIRLELSAEDSAVVLTLTDTGVGIPAEDLPLVFDRFHRVQNSRGRSFEGTGIGLSLTRELVLRHGGSIAAESVKDKGSVFIVTIPFGKAHLPPGQVSETKGDQDRLTLVEYIGELEALLPVRDAVRQPEQAAGDGRETVLIVDDNADMREYILSVIGHQYATVMASNGQEALSRVAELRPSLVLSDWMMPVMDGKELLRELKKNPDTSPIPVIMLTARAGEESLSEGFDTGADDYLVKPFSGTELLSRIKAQIRISHLRSRAYQQMKSLFMQAPVAIQILRGPEFVVDLINNRAAQVIGLTWEDSIGKPLEEVLPHAREQGYIDLLQRVYASGEPYTVDELPFDFLREGQRVPGFIRVIISPLRDDNDEIQGVLVTGSDVTAQVIARQRAESDRQERQSFAEKLEKEVEARTQALVKVNRELESFSYMTSHDLQEPLRKIQMFIDRLLQNREPAELLLHKMSESASRMRQLIKSTLDYGRLNQPEQALDAINLGTVMADVCRDFELMIEEKKASLHIGELPTVRANLFQMNQVFSNLLSNSLKFAREAPEISVTAERVTDYLLPVEGQPRIGRAFHRISFSDNGIGFDPRYSNSIFELFQRLHSSHQYSGTGIGLSIVKKIIEQHGGYIFADPGEPGGATFRIWLPVSEE